LRSSGSASWGPVDILKGRDRKGETERDVKRTDRDRKGDAKKGEIETEREMQRNTGMQKILEFKQLPECKKLKKRNVWKKKIFFAETEG